jgi:hypothetical protein
MSLGEREPFALTLACAHVPHVISFNDCTTVAVPLHVPYYAPCWWGFARAKNAVLLVSTSISMVGQLNESSWFAVQCSEVTERIAARKCQLGLFLCCWWLCWALWLWHVHRTGVAGCHAAVVAGAI